MRARVENAIADLDYSPAETARSLTSRKRTPGEESRIDASVPRLTTVGYVSVDYVACLDRLPEREERLMSDEIVKAVGGPAANVAAIAAGIGGPWPIAVSLITAIGTDQDSDWAAAELASRRVDLIMPRERREGRLNRALVLVEADGRRTIVNEPSNLAEVDVRRFVETTDTTGRTWCLHIEGYHVPRQIGAVPLARARGFRTSMQATGLPRDWLPARGEELFASFDAVVLHRESLALLQGVPTEPDAAMRHFSHRARTSSVWPQVVIVTLGPRGAMLVGRDGHIARADALDVPVQDTTGAGDAFVGTFLTLWLNGVEPDQAMRYACAAGSLAVTRFGAQDLRPSAARLEDALAACATLRAPALAP
jgi:ribokinase